MNVKKKVLVTFATTENAYLFIVTDNGLGLPLILRSGVFEVFLEEEKDDKNKYEEYLSNLNYARQMVDKLNGKIEVHFEEGAGSRFVFSVGK